MRTKEKAVFLSGITLTILFIVTVVVSLKKMGVR